MLPEVSLPKQTPTDPNTSQRHLSFQVLLIAYFVVFVPSFLLMSAYPHQILGGSILLQVQNLLLLAIASRPGGLRFGFVLYIATWIGAVLFAFLFGSLLSVLACFLFLGTGAALFLLKKKNAIEQSMLFRLEEQASTLHHLSYFDPLTHLPNRRMLLHQMKQLTHTPVPIESPFSVILIDLDNFKKINDTMGHVGGDTLLFILARRLQKAKHEQDMVGRLSGDEFILLVQRSLTKADLLDYADQVRHALQTPISMEQKQVWISASFGISCFPTDSQDPSSLLQFADSAMHDAKQSGKNQIHFFDRTAYEKFLKRLELEVDMQAAIPNNECFLVFQPQYGTQNKRLRGFEVLMRWHSPKWGAVSPMEFISLAEETGYILTVGEWILQTSCEKFQDVLGHETHPVLLSINISPIQIKDPSFIPMVRRVLAETGMPGKYLEFEVTESVFISSMEHVISVMNDLRKMQIQVALDDFGTGYSSLNYLQCMPLDVLKIDKSFIDTINKSERQGKIVASLIALVHHLNILVVAEGVEHEDQIRQLRHYSCDYIQGYLWGRPLEEAEMRALLESERQHSKPISP